MKIPKGSLDVVIRCTHTRRSCCHYGTNEREIDNRKSEVIRLVFSFLLSSSVVDCMLKVTVRSKLLSVSSIIYLKLVWIEGMQTITESLFSDKHHIYSGSWNLLSCLLSLFTRGLEGSLLHMLYYHFQKLYGRHHDFVDRYGISVSQMTTDMIHVS